MAQLLWALTLRTQVQFLEPTLDCSPSPVAPPSMPLMMSRKHTWCDTYKCRYIDIEKSFLKSIDMMYSNLHYEEEYLLCFQINQKNFFMALLFWMAARLVWTRQLPFSLPYYYAHEIFTSKLSKSVICFSSSLLETPEAQGTVFPHLNFYS